MSNLIPFQNPAQSSRIRALQEEANFRARIFLEAKAAAEKARAEFLRSTSEFGAPSDGRIIVVIFEATPDLAAGIHFETMEKKWVQKLNRFEDRSYEEALAWSRQMAAAGHPVGEPVMPTAG